MGRLKMKDQIIRDRLFAELDKVRDRMPKSWYRLVVDLLEKRRLVKTKRYIYAVYNKESYNKDVLVALLDVSKMRDDEIKETLVVKSKEEAMAEAEAELRKLGFA